MATSSVKPARPDQQQIPDSNAWQNDLRRLESRKDMRVPNPLYALPNDLLDAMEQVLPTWLNPGEVAFERDLSAFCARYHVAGVFNHQPVTSSLLDRPVAPVIDEQLFQKLGWGQHVTRQEANMGIQEGCGLLDSLQERSKAYVGWLLTYPLFLAERDHLRSRWEHAVQELGSIPAYPARAATDNSSKKRPRHGVDRLHEFLADFNGFYERWQLRRLATWDLPEPLGANLTGDAIPNHLPPSVSTFVIEVPPTLRLPATFPFRSRLEELQRAQTPEHLRPWLEAQEQQHEKGLRHGRFGTIFYLAYYRDTVLASRYHERLVGNAAKLDQAFGVALRLSTDSIKKLRLTMTNLRKGNA